MLEQCANLNATRQARQDGLIGTITQISSAALLAVPGFMLSSRNTHVWNWEMKLVLIALVVSLLSAMGEQHLSVKAHAKHVEIVQKYYLLESADREDKKSRAQVKLSRQFAYASFLVAIVLTSAGLFELGMHNG
jgi:hypothetical protein